MPTPDVRFAKRTGAVNLLVLGGSRGALAINKILPQALALIDPELRPQVMHQTGKLHCEMTSDLYKAAGVEAQVVPFIEQMEEAYGWADFAICRAGALTVAELTCAGLGSILIPFPHAIDDHQTVNGKLLVEQGSALMIQQKELSATMLAEEITKLCNSRSQLLDMAMRARKLSKTGAASRVAKVCMEVGCEK